MEATYDKIRAWLDVLTPDGCKVVIRDQNAPAPTPPFVTLKLGTVSDIARDYSEGVDEEGDQAVVRWVSITADIQVYGSSVYEAENIAQDIMDFAYFREQNLDILGRSLTFQLPLSAPQTVDGVIGAKMEPRVVMALGFSAARDLVYGVGAIETVIYEGTVDETTITDEVTANGD